MSRHRDFKGNNFDYSDDESHSNSVTDDENYGTSPNTAALYMYDEKKSGNSRDISNFMNYHPSLNISEECFPDQEDNVFVETRTNNNFTVKKDLKVGNIPKVESLTKISALNKVKETKETNLNVSERSGDRLASVPVERVAVATAPYDASAVLEAYKNHKPNETRKPLINLITIGHVDAGKSTLMGNLLCQMNYVSDKKLSKYKHEAQKAGKASFAYAWILDESVEERSRGITTDVAQTYFETENRKIGLLDAPGHKDFIPNMISGATQADAAILVVNATKGEFESGFDLGGQTREHTLLVRMLGISDLIVAVNKMDTVSWSQERFEEICDKVKKFLRPLRMNGLYCPVSGLLGTNLSRNSTSVEPQMSWYNSGPTLIDLIDQLEPPARSLEKPLRITVSDVFKPVGSGSFLVAGKIEAGGVSTSVPNLSRVLCMPGGVVATVKSIKVNSSTSSDEAGTCSELTVGQAFDGDQVLLGLTGVDLSLSLDVGSILCNPAYPVPFTNRIRAKLLILELKNNNLITRGFNAVFYYKSLDIPVQFKKLHSIIVREGKKEVEKQKPRFLPESCTAEVDLQFDKPICIEAYQDFKSLGKFTIRESGNTIAGGTVIKVLKSKC